MFCIKDTVALLIEVDLLQHIFSLVVAVMALVDCYRRLQGRSVSRCDVMCVGEA